MDGGNRDLQGDRPKERGSDPRAGSIGAQHAPSGQTTRIDDQRAASDETTRIDAQHGVAGGETIRVSA